MGGGAPGSGGVDGVVPGAFGSIKGGSITNEGVLGAVTTTTAVVSPVGGTAMGAKGSAEGTHRSSSWSTKRGVGRTMGTSFLRASSSRGSVGEGWESVSAVGIV